MSCDTLNRGAISLNVSLASLPEGFCPASMQELGNEIAARLIISPSTSFNTFSIGSTAPSSNVGPWLKDCLSWFVFNDATGDYIPITKGGFDSIQYFITSGTFVVPDFIYKLKIHAWGAGGGGSGNDGAGSNGSGGGGGAYGLSIVTVIPGQSIPYTIGSGGAGGLVSGAGGAGSATTILTLSAGGGLPSTSTIVAGAGGTPTGFTVGIKGQNGMANHGNQADMPQVAGGNAGGWGGSGGGALSKFIGAATNVGVTPGGGGGGATGDLVSTGGAGAGGAILIEY